MTDYRKSPDGSPKYGAKTTLQRIADVLNVPVYVFYQTHATTIEAGSIDVERDEILRLFLSLKRPSDRQRLVDFARLLVKLAE